MTARITTVIIFLLPLACEVAFAQIPKASTLQIESVTVNFSNIRVVTAANIEQDKGGSIPEGLVPLDVTKLLPPETQFFIMFDYKTDFSSSDDPKAIKTLYIGAEIGNGKSKGFQGYGPYRIEAASGTGVVRLANVFSSKQKTAEIETALTLYGRRNDNSSVSGVSTETIGFSARLDRFAQISETQFDALKGMYRRLQELENRVKSLEAREMQ